MKKFSKILMLMIALTLVFSIQMGISAAPISTATNFSVTINAKNIDDAFALYKLIDITYDSSTNTVAYAWTTAAQNYIGSLSNSSAYYQLKVKTFQSWSDESANLKSFLGGFATYVKAHGVTPDVSKSATNGVCTISGLEKGEYVILGAGSSSGAYIYQIMTASFKPDASYNINTTVTLDCKETTPTIDKTVNDPQVAIGDTVTYTVVVTVPTYPDGATNTAFSVADVLPAGVTFAGTSSVKSNTNITVPCTGTGASWVFNYNDIKAYSSITIKYTATVNSNILIGSANTNTATLTYSNNPYASGTYSKSDSTDIYSYGIEIFKADKSTASKLGGAEFKVYENYVDSSNTGTLVGTLTTVSGSGTGTLAGLDVGIYTLVETKAPTGYLLDSTPISVTITDTGIDGTVDSSMSTTTGYNGYITKTILDEQGTFTLPSTGGIGTWVFTIVGIGVMILAAVLLIMSSKKRQGSN